MGENNLTKTYQTFLDTLKFLVHNTTRYRTVSEYKYDLLHELPVRKHNLVSIEARPGKFIQGNGRGKFTGFFTNIDSCNHYDEILKIHTDNPYFEYLGPTMEMIGDRGQTVQIYGLGVNTEVYSKFELLLVGDIEKAFYFPKSTKLAKLLEDTPMYANKQKLDLVSEFPDLKERINLIRQY